MELSRFPQSVFRHGTEPDARFSLANERTFLAWIRTSLALMAAGFGLHLTDIGQSALPAISASVLLIGTGAVMPLYAYRSWANTEKSLRLTQPLPGPTLAGPLAVVLGIAGALILWALAG